jgi:hypothetical protein
VQEHREREGRRHRTVEMFFFVLTLFLP